MTKEKIAEVRKAVSILSKLSDEDWEHIIRLSKTFEEKPKLDENTLLEKELFKKVTEFMALIGIPSHIKGYKYIREAIIYYMKSKETHNILITKDIYLEVERKYKSSFSRVERGIRYGIEVAWNRGNIDILEKIFGYTVNSSKGKPTNAEFISRVAEYLKV